MDGYFRSDSLSWMNRSTYKQNQVQTKDLKAKGQNFQASTSSSVQLT